MSDRRRMGLVLACLLAAAPAGAQQPGRVFPPVPGPFLVAPAMPGMAAALPPASAPAPGPTFAPPVNAMRLPYWMQPGQPGQPAGDAPENAFVSAPATPSGEIESQPRAATGFGQATAPGAFPGYVAPAPWAGGPQPPAGPAQGFGAPAPGWAYAPPPGWGAQPYTPAPGWGGRAQQQRPGSGN